MTSDFMHRRHFKYLSLCKMARGLNAREQVEKEGWVRISLYTRLSDRLASEWSPRSFLYWSCGSKHSAKPD
jgi:hypothetical protein